MEANIFLFAVQNIISTAN